MTELNFIKRGQIFYVDLEEGVGSEQKGVRPCVIVQNNKGNANSNTVIVALITKSSRLYLPVHIPISKEESGLKHDSVIMTEQLRTVDKKRLFDPRNTLSNEKIEEINVGLAISIISESGDPVEAVELINNNGSHSA